MFQKDYVVKQDRENRIWCEPYVVRKNDSLTRVFQEKGGIIDENPEEFLKIFKRLNPQVKDFESIRPGQQIYIPLKKLGTDREFSSRIITLPMVTVSANKSKRASEPKPPSHGAGFMEYKIKPGDSLSRIFQQNFGVMNAALLAERMRLFRKINPDIADINRIHPGRIIRMPIFDSADSLEVRAGPLEIVSAQLNAKLTRKGIYFFFMPGKADFRLDLAQYPIMEFSDGLRILFNPGQALIKDEQNVIHHFWPELKIVDVPYDVSSDAVLEQVLKVAPYQGKHLKYNSRIDPRTDAASLRTPSPSSASPATGGHVAVRGKQQLVETLMRTLGISYTQNVEISFPYADIQISSHANWISSGKGKPVLVDFGSFYGDAIQALEKTGFVVIQILDTDSIHQAIPRLLNAIGVSFTTDSEIQAPGQPPLKVPGIWIQGNSLPSVILTDAALGHHLIRTIQEKGIILITEKKNTG